MAKVFFHSFGGDIVTMMAEKIGAQIKSMNIDEIFDGAIKREIPILEAHPISVLTSEIQSGDNTTLMARIPSIGIIEMSDDEAPKQLMAAQVATITKDTIDAYKAQSEKDRWRQGTIASDSTLDVISAYLDTLTDKEIDAITNRELRMTDVKISIWAHHPVALRLLKNITRAVIQNFKTTLEGNYKMMSFDGVGNLYNFDFGRILYGWDWNIKLVGAYETIPIDTDVQLINEIDEAAYINDDVSKFDSTPRFHSGGDVYKEAPQ